MTEEDWDELDRKSGHNDGKWGHPPAAATNAYLEAYAKAMGCNRSCPCQLSDHYCSQCGKHFCVCCS